jgi:predicted acetyltransferase
LADNLSYRFAETADADRVASLVSHSFPGAARPLDWWREQLTAPAWGGELETTLFVAEERGRAVAACQLHPLRQWVGGEALAVAGVGTVSVAPTHRRRRVGGELMRAALRAARERGDVASSLFPFRTAFYQQLGYGRAGDALQYQVAPEALPDSPERRHVELLDTDAGRAEALSLYSRWMHSQTGQLERSEKLWAGITGGSDRVLVGYRADDGELAGYALAVYRPDLPPQSRYLEVDELVWTSPAARRGLYGWLASLGDQWQQLLVRALPSQRMGDWIREPRLPHGAAPPWRLWSPAATLLSGTMFRILHMERAWQQRRVAAGPAITLVIDVSDPDMRENAGTWRLVLEEGRAHVERNNGGEADVCLDVSTLSRLFIGSLPATAALEAGLLQCNSPERLHALDAALMLPEPWTFDRF